MAIGVKKLTGIISDATRAKTPSDIANTTLQPCLFSDKALIAAVVINVYSVS
jgi:hypothetical protein